MIDICLWRGRIGCFHLARVAAALRRGKKQAPGDGKIDASLLDVIIFCIVLLSLVKVFFCIYSNVQAAGSYPFVSTLEGIPRKQTLSSWEESPHISVLESKLFFHVPVVVSLCVGNLAWSVRKILLSNDVERNPGPEHGSQSTDTAADAGKQDEVKAGESGSVGSAEILLAIQKQGQLFQAQTEQLKQQLKEHSSQTDEQNKRIAEGLEEIKGDLRKVNEECEKINQRCSQLEEKHRVLADQVRDNSGEVKVLQAEVEGREEENRRLTGKVEDLTKGIASLESEVDRLESFSRRNNIKIFGIPEDVTGKDEDCREAVRNVLETYIPEKEWGADVIERAHRLGKPDRRNPNPRPIIAKFQRWGDAMRLMKDNGARADMQNDGLRATQDLTRRQALTLKQLRDQGQTGYFVNGKLRIKDQARDNDQRRPRSPDRVFINNNTHRQARAGQPISERVPGDYDVTADLGRGPRTRAAVLRERERGAVGGSGGGVTRGNAMTSDAGE